MPADQWWTPPAAPSSAFKDKTKVTCSACQRWVYAHKLPKYNYECLCGARFPHGPKKAAKAKKSTPPQQEDQVVTLMEKLAKQSGPRAAAAKTFLEAAKAALPGDKAKTPAATVAEVTAKVTRAETAFTKAQQQKAKLLRSLQEADDRIRETGEALAKAEAERAQVFLTVAPPAVPAAGAGKQILLTDMLKGELPIDFSDGLDQENLNEAERSEVESRVKAVKDLIVQATKAALEPIAEEIRRRHTEVQATCERARKRRRASREAGAETAAAAEPAAAPAAAPGERALEAVETPVPTEEQEEDPQAALRKERQKTAEDKVKKESEALLEEFRQRHGADKTAASGL